MKKIMSLFLCIALLLTMVGCGAEFDAQAYVQSVLDAKFHEEYKDYANQIGISEEEAKKQMEKEFEKSLETLMAEFKESYGITEEEMKQYVQLEKELRSKVKYTVESAKKDEDGNYSVTVQFKPVLVHDDFEKAFTSKLTEAVQSGMSKGQYMGVLLECLESCVEQAENSEKTAFTFHVIKSEKDQDVLYSISDEEMIKADSVATGR